MADDLEGKSDKLGSSMSRRELLRLLSMAALFPGSAELLAAQAPPRVNVPKAPVTPRIRPRPTRVAAAAPELHGVIREAAPMSTEEEEVAALLADQINHALAVVASDPSRPFPPGSFAAQIREPFLKLDARVKASAKKRAQDFLSKPPAAPRQPQFALSTPSQICRHRYSSSTTCTARRTCSWTISR